MTASPPTDRRSVEIEATQGVVTITTNPAGECVAVTRCDIEGKILKIIWQRAQSPEPRAKRSVTLSGYDLKSALDFVAPDDDAEQLETEVTIDWGQIQPDEPGGAMYEGYRCSLAEYPEEGSIPLDGKPDSPETKPEKL